MRTSVLLPTVAERFDALEDALELALRMWSGDDAPFAGRRLRAVLARAIPDITGIPAATPVFAGRHDHQEI